MMGHYSSPTDTNDGALFSPLIPMMGHYSSHTDTNDGAPSLVSVGGIWMK
ncbi:unnamed protein product [Staurois parvus]|uniref:Uncharacterized protein n=1 Tax=Staurois parvus TaxID=386267 RepID=A0ABN9D2C9_9NEOB|nr:unnamed protein product [Staurois parvus]